MTAHAPAANNGVAIVMRPTVFRFVPRVTAVIMLASCISTARADPHLDQTALFAAGERGYALYRIPGIIVTPKGSVLAYCEARRSASGDWNTIDIWMRRSTDRGDTWQDARKIVTPPDEVQQNPVALAQNLARPGEVTINNPVAIADAETGEVHFLYCIEYARCYYMNSRDDGQTFSRAVDITDKTFGAFKPDYDWKVLATGPGHGIQLSRGRHKGRLIVPVWLSTGTGGHAHRPSQVSVIYSDDHGRTWQAGDVICRHPTPVNPSETVIVQLADGRVMVNVRHEGVKEGKAVPGGEPRFRGIAISDDGAHKWSPLRYDEALPEPICMGSIARVTGKPEHDRNRIVFANPYNTIDRTRRNVSVYLSYDEGATWPVRRTLEPGISGYSDLAVDAAGTIYCFYERGSVDNTNYRPGTLTVARFNIDWLTAGKDTFKP